ncbi:alpha/beta hydrolase family protein [Gemmata sp.]|uniref:alpha/beta hydrolase family protein n=1 Tax=Gemmata sp. TaxID=1914242 RepID=UPI003F70FAAC
MPTRALGLLALFVAPCALAGRPAAYDPLAAPKGALPEPIDTVVKDRARDREIPVRVFLPSDKAAAKVVLFSHGLGGSREMNAFLGRHWAGRGYAVVFLQHPGSDTSVWKGKAPKDVMPAMQKAASVENFSLRVKDVPAVLDQLEVWNKEAGHALSGRLDLSRVGMSGHSFGAVTTQAVSGQTFPGGKALFTDPRIKAAVAFSPSAPAAGDPKKAFGEVTVPWLLMTGTKDTSPIRDIDLKSRLAVFPALPAGSKYEVVLDNAEHSAFTERSLPGEREKRNPNHHKVILALSTAFWDAYLRDDAAARAWLDGDGPKSVLEKGDTWQKK